MVKVVFKNEDFMCKSGEVIQTTRVRITNDNGNYLEFLDFNFKLPVGIENYELNLKNDEIQTDSYKRYVLGDYVVSGKYTMSLNILINN